MNETSGSMVSDASSLQNTGTANAAADIGGRFGYCRQNQSSSNAISIPHSSSLNFGTNPFTVEAWINIAYYDQVGGHIFHKYTGGTVGWNDGLDPSGIGFGLFNPAENQSLYCPTSIIDGRWHHIAHVRDGVRIRTYVDGKILGEAVGTTVIDPDNATPLEIGMQGGNPTPLKGFFDEIRISNIARSPQEFNLQLPPKNLTAGISGIRVNLSWQNGGGAVGLLRYKIYRGADSTNLSLLDSTIQLLYTNSGLTPGATYFYRISAVDSTGFEGAMSYAASAMIPIPSPTITSFTPTSGPVGTTVTITGKNFNTTASNNVVYFGAVKATVTSASSTSLTVTVPVGATYQSIIVTDLTTGLTAYSAKPFIVTYTGGGYISSSIFATKVDFTTGVPRLLAIGDLDGDGKPDLVEGNWGGNAVTVFRNTSSIGSITSSSFASKVDFATGNGPWALRSAIWMVMVN